MFKWKTSNVVLLFAALGAGIPAVSQTHIQTTTLFQTSTATTISKIFASASNNGDLIVVHLDWDGQTRSISSVTDTKGNHYAKISGTTNWNGINYAAELWYAFNITGGAGAITITATLSGAPTTFSQIYMSEYSGIAAISPLDQNSVAIGSTAAVSSGSMTTTQANELIYGVSIGASGALTTGAGFTNRSTANGNIVEDMTVSATGSYKAAFTSAGGNWIAQMATFVASATLPVSLVSFTGNCDHNNIVLNWTTAEESNNAFFTIEASTDGNDWSTLGTVKTEGNSSLPQKYSFTTAASNDKIVLYRLMQTDLDGKSTYFNTIRVNTCASDLFGMNIYPNPSNGKTLFGTINLSAANSYSIEIFDNLGKRISRYSSTQPEFAINFAQLLPSGTYYCKLSAGTYSKVETFLVKH